MNISIKVTDVKGSLAKKLTDNLNAHFIESVRAVLPQIERDVRTLVIEAIKGQPEYNSLLNGKLKGDFGLDDPSFSLANILDAWSESIHVLVIGGKRPRFQIQMIPGDFNDVMGLRAANQITEEGDVLPWLEWLLLKGDTTIVREFYVKSKPGTGRSGLAFMAKKAGARWGVRPEFAGTQRNNWVTRAIDQIPNSVLLSAIVIAIRTSW